MEKKTFKNIGWVSGDLTSGEGWMISDQHRTQFPRDEWDMEVTFTKKVKPVEVGDQVLYYGTYYEVVGVYGNYLWLNDPHDDPPSLLTVQDDQVRRVS